MDSNGFCPSPRGVLEAMRTAHTNSLMIVLAVINVGLTCWHIGGDAFRLSLKNHPTSNYSYVGDDYPLVHPSVTLNPASMSLQESIRYGPNGSNPFTSREWESLKRNPEGLGRAILGPEKRQFLMTFYHQLHCIREIQRGLYDTSDTEATPHHMKHCMDYLRQTILCSATDMLEKGDFLERNWETQRKALGDDLACWDWESIYQDLEIDWRDFEVWRDHSQDGLDK